MRTERKNNLLNKRRGRYIVKNYIYVHNKVVERGRDKLY